MPAATKMHRLVHNKFGTGFRADKPDFRDVYFKDTLYKKGLKIDNQIDWTSRIGPCWDQGDIGSCVAHGVGSLVAYVNPNYMPSRLKLYYDGRVIEKTVSIDSGLEIRDGVKAAVTVGVCPESMWAYDTSKFKKKAPAACYTKANDKFITKYSRVNNTIDEMLNCLQQGSPIVIGATLYESFESDTVAKNGVVPMPTTREQTIGGHCTAIYGADVSRKMFLVRNSWGTDWGIHDGKHNGYYWFPFAYAENTDLVSDCWMITQ